MNVNSVYVEVVAFLRYVSREAWRGQTTLDILRNRRRSSLSYATFNDGSHPAVSDKYAGNFRRKTTWELIRLSCAVCGIEFCYAAETAFVTPTLLHLGIPVRYVTLIWCLSPMIGFIVTPLIGSLSDTCTSSWGRRRPFILLLAIGIMLGLALVPNGNHLGKFFASNPEKGQTWGIVLTILGTVLLDFCSDACQSPARTYLLDVTLPEDHATGLSTFTVLAGLGGSLGYALGAIDWNGIIGGNHLKIVFALVSIIFMFCVGLTVTSFTEVPLELINDPHESIPLQRKQSLNMTEPSAKALLHYHPSLTHYLKSIIFMPTSLRILCLTNLFCWMSLVCYSLYFTDFVAESVFKGNPNAEENSEDYQRYQVGVRTGCWGMAIYSVSCSMYSLVLESLIRRFGAKTVYVLGPLTYSLGMLTMALVRNPAGVVVLSATAGIMYSTLFTIPYLLVAHYHLHETLDSSNSWPRKEFELRGIGTDVSAVSSMLFLAQFLLSAMMGTLIEMAHSPVITVCMAALFSACGALCATKVTYMQL